MPRVSKAVAAAHHQAIEDAASRLFRQRGLRGVSVAEVMAEVGLTHGGFYAHYPSKDDLAAAACAAAFAHADEKWRRRVATAGPAGAGRRAIAEGYLKPAGADPASVACPTATLVTDVAREPAAHPIHAAYRDGVRRQIAVLAALGDGDDPARDRATACVQLATMLGALLLARATRGDALSSEILDAARAHLAAASTDPPASAAPAPAAARHGRRRGLPKADGR
ncbi:MAG: TetR/AcrR family transcriptional regulator [Vicinamibacterales bacterium]